MTPGYRWACWLLATFGTFAWLEAWALRERSRGIRGTTLTSTLRRWCGVTPTRRHRHVAEAGLAGFLIWFYGHIFRGWKP